MPGDIAQLSACEPVYETLPGWTAPTAGVRRFEDLPAEARRYLDRMQEMVETPITYVSVGTRRSSGWREDADHPVLRETVHWWLDMWKVSDTLAEWLRSKEGKWRTPVYNEVINTVLPSLLAPNQGFVLRTAFNGLL